MSFVFRPVGGLLSAALRDRCFPARSRQAPPRTFANMTSWHVVLLRSIEHSSAIALCTLSECALALVASVVFRSLCRLEIWLDAVL